MSYARDNIGHCADCPAVNHLPKAPRCNLQRRTLTDEEWMADSVPSWCPLREGTATISLAISLRRE